MICTDCGKEIISHDNLVYVDGEYRHLCEECFGNYTECSVCGDYFLTRFAYHSDDSLICPNCYNTTFIYNDEMNLITGYHDHNGLIHTMFKLPNEQDNLFFGIELEIDRKSHYQSINSSERNLCAKEIMEVLPNNFIYFESDGSLYEGFENITQPATLKYHESLKDQYKKMFSIIRNHNLRSHQTSTCGLHVHFNRNFFTPDEEESCVAKILYLIERFWGEVVIFSRRKLSNIERWAGRYGIDNCNKIAHEWKNKNYLDRYYAVNLTNENTIEFRIFRGTLKWNSFIATIQFCYNVVTYAKYKTISELQNMCFEDLITTPELKQYWENAQERVRPKVQNTDEQIEVVSGDIVENIG